MNDKDRGKDRMIALQLQEWCDSERRIRKESSREPVLAEPKQPPKPKESHGKSE
jgi:hypothetical protein